MKLELTRGKRKPSFMENDVLWNGIGSMTYALASMVLAFFVLRLGGEEQGGVFGFGYSTLGQQFFIIAYFGLRPFQITDMKGEFSFREYRQFRYITGGLALVFAFVFLFFQYAMGFYSGEKSVILFFLCLFKIMDAYCDVYESELQRRGFLHKGGQSMFLRTLFSVFLLLLVLAFSKNLFLAVVSMNMAQGLSFIFFSLFPIQKTKPLGEEKGLSRESLQKLWKATFTLFLSVFLDFYVFSSSKYAVDRVFGSSRSGIYNLLFMPGNFIYLLANFIIRPALPQMAVLFQEGKEKAFRKKERALFFRVAILSFILFLLALIFSGIALSILEWILGTDFSGKFTGERISFCILILGGAFYALANTAYYLLILKRKQKWVFIGYGLAAFLSFLSVNQVVAMGGFFYGSLHFLSMMCFLFLFFFMAIHSGGRVDFQYSGRAS